MDPKITTYLEKNGIVKKKEKKTGVRGRPSTTDSSNKQ